MIPTGVFNTCDNTYGTCDTINVTADGAIISNGGGYYINPKTQAQPKSAPTFTDAAYLRF
jgi:hypothetical protein